MARMLIQLPMLLQGWRKAAPLLKIALLRIKTFTWTCSRQKARHWRYHQWNCSTERPAFWKLFLHGCPRIWRNSLKAMKAVVSKNCLTLSSDASTSSGLFRHPQSPNRLNQKQKKWGISITIILPTIKCSLHLRAACIAKTVMIHQDVTNFTAYP